MHPEGTGAPKKTVSKAIGKSRGGWTTKPHLVAAGACDIVTWRLTPGQCGDAPEGRRPIEAIGGPQEAGKAALLMDSACEGDATRELARQPGIVPVVPPNPQRREPWQFAKALYCRRNEASGCFADSKPGAAYSRAMTRPM